MRLSGLLKTLFAVHDAVDPPPKPGETSSQLISKQPASIRLTRVVIGLLAGLAAWFALIQNSPDYSILNLIRELFNGPDGAMPSRITISLGLWDVHGRQLYKYCVLLLFCIYFVAILSFVDPITSQSLLFTLASRDHPATIRPAVGFFNGFIGLLNKHAILAAYARQAPVFRMPLLCKTCKHYPTKCTLHISEGEFYEHSAVNLWDGLYRDGVIKARLLRDLIGATQKFRIAYYLQECARIVLIWSLLFFSLHRLLEALGQKQVIWPILAMAPIASALCVLFFLHHYFVPRNIGDRETLSWMLREAVNKVIGILPASTDYKKQFCNVVCSQATPTYSYARRIANSKQSDNEMGRNVKELLESVHVHLSDLWAELLLVKLETQAGSKTRNRKNRAAQFIAESAKKFFEKAFPGTDFSARLLYSLNDSAIKGVFSDACLSGAVSSLLETASEGFNYSASQAELPEGVELMKGFRSVLFMRVDERYLLPNTFHDKIARTGIYVPKPKNPWLVLMSSSPAVFKSGPLLKVNEEVLRPFCQGILAEEILVGV